MSVHGERIPDLVRERTRQERESHARLYPRPRLIEAAPIHPPGVNRRHAQHGAAREAAAAHRRVAPVDPSFTAPITPSVSVNGPRVPAPRDVRATPSSSDNAKEAA